MRRSGRRTIFAGATGFVAATWFAPRAAWAQALGTVFILPDADCEVRIDDEDIGALQGCRGRVVSVSMGEHVVHCRRSNGESRQQLFHVSGTTQTVVRVNFPRTCEACNGSGETAVRQCTECGGDGRVRATSRCLTCRGDGRRCGDQECTSCNGRGRGRCGYCGGRGQVRSGPYDVTCPSCNGAGIAPCLDCGGDGNVYSCEIRCQTCNGSGTLERETECAACHGNGAVSERCGVCGGDGRTEGHACG